MLLHPLQIYIFYIFMKKLCLSLFDLRGYAEQKQGYKILWHKYWKIDKLCYW